MNWLFLRMPLNRLDIRPFEFRSRWCRATLLLLAVVIAISIPGCGDGDAGVSTEEQLRRRQLEQSVASSRTKTMDERLAATQKFLDEGNPVAAQAELRPLMISNRHHPQVLLLAEKCEGNAAMERPSEPDSDRIDEAALRLRQGRAEEALQITHEILRATPEHPGALKLAIDIHSRRKEFSEAADYGARLAMIQTPAAPGLLLQCFDWNLRSGRYDLAEANLLVETGIAPRDIEARRLLVQLYNAQGRRFETREHIEELIRLKAVNWSETLSLVDLRGPFTLVTFDQVIDESELSLFWLGEMRTAYVGHDRNRSDVIATVQRIVDAYPNSAAAAAFYGRLLVENGRDQAIQDWFASLPEGTQRQPEYWTTLGTWLQHNNRHREAIRAFGEALRFDPGNREALRELIESLDSTGAEQQAVPLRKQLAILDQIFRIARDADAEQSMWIASQMQKFTRPWEAMAWMMHSAQLAGTFPQIIPELNRRAISVAQWESSTTPDRIAEVRLATLLGFDISDWPIPELGNLRQDHTEVAASTSREALTDVLASDSLPQIGSPVHSLHLDDIAADIGLATHTDTGYFDQDSFYAYQVDGSGIAVVDYDLNGLPDLYIMQSAGPPNDPSGSNPNQLFRSLPGGSFIDVTMQSGTGDRGYGAGVAVGDVNQDGFPDLLIGNVGASVLFVNQGDGSFRDASALIQDNPVTWTSSFAIADLSGDHLPELIQVNYINDETAFKIKCTGAYLDCQPQRFRAAADRVLKGNSDGTFSTWQSLRTIDDDPKLGLGLVVANFDKQHGNDFFVSNDGDLNHFWSSIPADGDADDRFSMVESAGVRGCSIGQGGTSQACMGIAAGDFNRDGMLDLHVTNFYHEPVNLFIQNRLGFFSDQAMIYGLQAPSMPVLGFGTQTRDYDNDGWLDLATLNGHVFDATDQGMPFRMQAQLLKGNRRGFTLQQPTEAGDYWQRKHLGRSLAVWDWNQDGRMDLVANHLDQPVAVLQNNSDALNWLQLELVGTTSERDAIGAVATITAGPESWTAHRTAGDGYMVSNEAVLHFGIGNLTTLDHVEVQWPSGQIQSFDNVACNARYLLIEGSGEAFLVGEHQ